jgi:hypothetical protein
MYSFICFELLYNKERTTERKPPTMHSIQKSQIIYWSHHSEMCLEYWFVKVFEDYSVFDG